MIWSKPWLNHLRSVLVGAVVVGTLALAGCGGTSSTVASTPTDTVGPAAPTATTAGAANTVKIVNSGGGFAFTPKTLTVPVGTTVTWNNVSDTAHTSTSDDSSAVKWASPDIQPGSTFQFTFTKAGTYTYHCNIHPSMTATIVVTG
jgi:plastocyanin